MATALKISRGKKVVFLAVYCFLLLLFFFAAAEILVRFRGYRPFVVEKADIKVEPGGRFFTNHAGVGYCQLPGTFKVTLKSNYTFTVTHGSDSLRITHPVTATNAVHRPEIWIMGCSFTHGWSVNDEQTYPWLLQTRMPQYEIVNFGVNGYGTLHSMLQFKEALKERGKPAAVVVAYAGFHDERNTFTRLRRKAVAPYNQLGPLQQPYARLDRDGKVQYFMAPVEYQEFPLMRYSAFVHFLEWKYDLYEERAAHSQEVTRGIVKEFSELCRTNDVQFFVAGITRDASRLLEFCQREKIPNVDISVDLSTPGNRNLPYDDHPSAATHQQYATKLEAFLTNGLTSKIVK